MRYKRRHTKTRTKKKQPQKTVIQHHHISYSNPEWIVPLFKGEHFILGQMNWRKKTSQGFIIALKEYIRIKEKSTINLGAEKRDSSQ